MTSARNRIGLAHSLPSSKWRLEMGGSFGGLRGLRPSQNVGCLRGASSPPSPLFLFHSLSLYLLPRLVSSLCPDLISNGDTVSIPTTITVILLLVTEASIFSRSVARASVALKEPFRSDESTAKSAPRFLFHDSMDIEYEIASTVADSSIPRSKKNDSSRDGL